MLKLAALLAAFLLCGAPAVAQTDASLNAQLQGMAHAYHGKVALYATDLRSGKSVALNADTAVPTASVIKLTVLFEALKQIEAGQAALDDRLTLTKANQVGGSGVLGLFDTPQTLTLKDALTLMVVLSDNSATNLVIDKLGLKNIDARIQWMGLRNTWLYKKVFQPPLPPVPADQPKFGLGKTTPREMAQVIERFALCNLDAPNAAAPPTPAQQHLCNVALDMLKNQQDDAGIPRYLNGLTVANKTGALDAVRNDVGIVYAPDGPIVISAFTYDNADKSWTVDNAAQVLIARMAAAIVHAWH